MGRRLRTKIASVGQMAEQSPHLRHPSTILTAFSLISMAFVGQMSRQRVQREWSFVATRTQRSELTVGTSL